MDRSSVKRIANNINRKNRRKAQKLIRINKHLQPGKYFSTGCNRKIQIIRKTDKSLFVKSQAGKSIIEIPINSIEKMAAYFFQVRLVERKELEVFHRFNSIMFGLLTELFSGNAKKSFVGRLLRLIMTGVRIYFAGGDHANKDLKFIAKHGGGHVLLSYYYIKDRHTWRILLKQNGLRCILDSGAFSEWRAKEKGKVKKPIRIDEYIQFIKDNLDVIDHYFAYDCIGDYKKCRENLKYMESKGLTPIPVYHLGTPITELDELVAEGYPVIALGGTVGQKGVKAFLTRVFTRYPNFAFHGLGITNPEYILNFPFFSCDSTAWIQCRKKEVVLTERGQKEVPELCYEQRLERSVKFLTALERPSTYQRISPTFKNFWYRPISIFEYNPSIA